VRKGDTCSTIKRCNRQGREEDEEERERETERETERERERKWKS
jgi:hypothetical protein